MILFYLCVPVQVCLFAEGIQLVKSVMVLAASLSVGSGGWLAVSLGLASISVTLTPKPPPKASFKGLHRISALAGGRAFIVCSTSLCRWGGFRQPHETIQIINGYQSGLGWAEVTEYVVLLSCPKNSSQLEWWSWSYSLAKPGSKRGKTYYHMRKVFPAVICWSLTSL